MSPGLEVPMHTKLVTLLIELQPMWAAAPAAAIPLAPPPPHLPLTPPSLTSRTHARTAAPLLPVLLNVTNWIGAIPSATAALQTAPPHRCVRSLDLAVSKIAIPRSLRICGSQANEPAAVGSSLMASSA